MGSDLPVLPLTAETFRLFGDVIEPDTGRMHLINGGTTERFHALAQTQALGEGAKIILNIFRGQPRSFPYAVDMMERHPFGSQSFTPLSGRPFLVVVAKDEGGVPGRPEVFFAAPHQGVNYRANVWHHPLMALDEVSDFLVADRTGPGNNLEEYFYSKPYFIKEPRP